MSNYKKTGMVRIKPKKLTALNFKKYGHIIQWEGPENEKESNQFRIVIREPKVKGWRIAYLIVREKNIKFLEEYVKTPSPSGFEMLLGGQKVWINHVKQFCHRVTTDNYGNAYAYYEKNDPKKNF